MKDFKNSPLWVIAFFMVVAETVFGVAISQTSNGSQITALLFFILYTLFVTGCFFYFLWHRPINFYAPDVYGENVTPEQFAKLFRYMPPSAVNAVQKVKDTPNNENSIFEFINGFLSDKDRQHLILMLKEQGRMKVAPNNHKEYSHGYSILLRNGELTGGTFLLREFLANLSNSGFLQINGENKDIFLSEKGTKFVKWLTDNKKDALAFECGLGWFGEGDTRKDITDKILNSKLSKF